MEAHGWICRFCKFQNFKENESNCWKCAKSKTVVLEQELCDNLSPRRLSKPRELKLTFSASPSSSSSTFDFPSNQISSQYTSPRYSFSTPTANEPEFISYKSLQYHSPRYTSPSPPLNPQPPPPAYIFSPRDDQFWNESTPKENKIGTVYLGDPYVSVGRSRGNFFVSDEGRNARNKFDRFPHSYLQRD